MKYISVLKLAAALAIAWISPVEAAAAGAHNNASCGSMDRALIVDEVLQSVKERRYFKRYQYDEVEISPNQMAYNDTPRVWSVEFFLVFQGKKTERFFAMRACDGSIEYSIDQNFKTGPNIE
ncbi:MAG: hypothetical protein QHC90_29920 [Shinella sp.]|nr:hypothetical protein [Shinella sp.]